MKKLILGILFTAVCLVGYSQNMPNYYVTASGTDTYTVYVNGFGGGGYNNKIAFVRFPNTNTGSATININSLGAVTLKKWDGSAWVNLVASDISVDTDYRISYDNTNVYFRTEGSNLGSSGSTYWGTSPTTITVGGLSSGSAISGLAYDDIIQSIVAPYVNPNWTYFLNNQAQAVEVKTQLTGTRDFTWNVNNNSGIVTDIDIYDVTGVSTLLAATPDDGAQAAVAITTITLTLEDDQQRWRGIANNTSPSGTVNSSDFTITAYYYLFTDPVSSVPANSAAVRSMTSVFLTSANQQVAIETGTVETTFVIAVPPGHSIVSITDEDALGLVITGSYIFDSTVAVTMPNATTENYDLYVMTVGDPYPTSHTHLLTIN
jgi:hypothetical protein